MAKNNLIAAIDVGTTKVCTLLASVDETGGMTIVGMGLTPSQGLQKGMVVNINEAKESIRESVRQAEQSSATKVDAAYVGVTGRHVSSINHSGIVSISRGDRLVRPEDLKRVLEMARSVSIPSDRNLLHVIPRSYTLDGQTGVKNPVGMHGSRLDVETHIITTAVASVQNLVKCIRGVGVEIEDLVLEPIASAEAVLSEEEKEAGVILADIGGGTTDIAIFREGSIWHTAVVPVAGYQMTRDIAIGLGLPFDVAESMKKKYGNIAAPKQNGKDSSNPPIVGNGHGISYRELNEIIATRAEEILRLISMELPDQEYEKLVPAGLVLTGGSSNLAGLDIVGQDVMGMPVRVGAPTGLYGIADNLNDPAFATVVGLLVWGMKKQEYGDSWRDRGFGGTFRRLISRVRRLIRS